MSEQEFILTNLHRGVLTITLNRPKQLNAFNEAMHLAFHEALRRAHDENDIRAVLITGAGRGFCAGQDLGDRDPDSREVPDLSHTIRKFYTPAVELITKLPKPVIMAVNGVAAGAGANLAFHGDIVLAAHSAKFIQSFSKIGLMPDAGGSWLLPHMIGLMRAKAYAMLAEPLSSQKACEWGLVWEVIDDEHLFETAQDMAFKLAQGATKSYGVIKQAMAAASSNSLDEQLALEAQKQGELGRSYDYSEGVRAFLQKRPARFKGE